jgi:hypothetical protein
VVVEINKGKERKGKKGKERRRKKRKEMKGYVYIVSPPYP